MHNIVRQTNKQIYGKHTGHQKHHILQHHMLKEADIKSLSVQVTNMAWRDVGYGEMRQFVFNVLTELAGASYRKGAEDREHAYRVVREAQERAMEKRFKKVLDGLMCK